MYNSPCHKCNSSKEVTHCDDIIYKVLYSVPLILENLLEMEFFSYKKNMSAISSCDSICLNWILQCLT